MEMRKKQRLLSSADGILECQDDSFWTSAQSRIQRPLPSTNLCVLRVTASATAESNKKLPPVLTTFLSAVGKLPSGQEVNIEENGASDTSAASTNVEKKVVRIDDSSLSTIAPGKHKRYKTLLLLSTKQKGLNPIQRKEFKKLNASVKEEQRAYRQALVEFWENNKEQVLLGFSPSSRSFPAAKFAQAAVDSTSLQGSWLKHFKAKTYGKCLQVISLELGRQQGNKARTWTVNEIEGEDVTSGNVQEFDLFKPKTEPQTLGLPEVGSTISLPRGTTGTSLLLRDDATALMIAKQNGVNTVATLEALETILAMEHESNWLLPLSIEHGIAMVDLPAPPRFSSPRTCLTRGFERALREGLRDKEMGHNEESEPYRYVLLTLPASMTARKRKTKVLVRVPQQSTRAHAHLEYFPGRGEEIPSPFERSVWILDSFLFSRSVVGRIDPSTCSVLGWEETSVAHALATIDASTTTQDPIDNWDCLAQLLQAIPSIGQQGSYLLCSPGRDHSSASSRSVSVHMETHTQGTIQIEQELDKAGEVQLGSESIERSMRDWRWCHDRVPYTFPPPTQAEAKSGGTDA